MINNELTLLGVGSIGKNLLNSVIKKNIFTRINIFDDDKVEKHNIVYNKNFIGEDKVFACQKQFGNIINPIKKFIYDDNITKHDKEIFNKSKYIIDCRDMHENRKRFSAIKLFISNNKLIADFRKKIDFKNPVSMEYVAHIDNTKIRYLMANFTKLLLNEQKINNMIEHDDIITISTINHIDKIDTATKYIFSKKNIKNIEQLVEKYKIETIDVDIEDGLYNIFHKSFICNNNVPSILYKAQQNCDHFSANYIKYYIYDNKMMIKIINQTGGA